MPRKTNAENQRQFIAARRAQGLKRVILWARPADVDALKTIARQPHAIVKLHRKVKAELEAELRPVIEAKVRAKLYGQTERAMLAQMRDHRGFRPHPASNRPPPLVRFDYRPPAVIRNRLKAEGWRYDPVACVLAPA